MAPLTLAFDIYGTIIDVHGLTAALGRHVGDRAGAFSRLWRQKQLEYTFHRALMGRNRNFDVCTHDALAHACEVFSLSLDCDQEVDLLAAYLELPAFPDVREALTSLQQDGTRLFAFSNGTSAAVSGLLERAGVRHCFVDVVSCDEVKSFKPELVVYRHFLRRAGAAAERTWLVSSNCFDCLGAISAGMRAAWVRRSRDNAPDRWEIEPTVTIDGLAALAEMLPVQG